MARNQQNAQHPTKAPRLDTAPDVEDKLVWEMSVGPDGRTVNVKSKTNLGLLAAYSALNRTHKALQCPGCGGTNLRLTQREMSNDNGTFQSYVMCCGNRDCGGMLSFGNSNKYPDLLTEPFDDRFKEWWFPQREEVPTPTSAPAPQASARSSRGNTPTTPPPTTRGQRPLPPPEPEEDTYDAEEIPF